MSHILEVYFNLEPDLYMLDCFMEGLMKTVIKYTPIALREPENYEARANLMWTSSWAINGFVNGGKQPGLELPSHGARAVRYLRHHTRSGLAILTPRWLTYCLDETTVSKYVQFGVEVFGIDAGLPPMNIAKQAIDELSAFLFDTLGLARTFTEVGIRAEDFPVMAKKACEDGVLAGFKPLRQSDIEKIFTMCL